MFTNISWTNYTIVASLLLASWYLFIAFRFYFEEIKEIVTGSRKFQFSAVNEKSTPQSKHDFKDHEFIDSTSSAAISSFVASDTTFQDVDALVERIKSVIADAINRKILKQELLDYLRLVLEEYPTVKNSPFRSSVSEFIVSESAKIETIDLIQAEVEDLWDDKI
ncbi:hypothetical protein [Flavobacterium turcicum]|uniref:Uncharacterized protein n=1 Tax=Flavobacterium turcicum TaxID=2764718 RepID=A0ABR7JED6_9FLAO|nr:hypothetical protein [Flavobacterium turcicum]MBC5862863.1 hypothetical protein [Flavobacterium turcicum]NHL01595.1 hypothetical protein [Flavobacterium turcicum]